MKDYSTIFNIRGHLYNEAMALCPNAREAERARLIELLAPQAGECIGDSPAGGGYLAEGIHASSEGAAEIICIEPSELFSEAIPPTFKVIRTPLEHVPELRDAGLDAIASLVGLHHYDPKIPVYREWARLLKPGGRLVIADVETGTATAEFLNTFVHTHTPGGHEGVFFRPGELMEELGAAGFEDIQEMSCEVPWEFPDEETMVTYCGRLFAIESAGRSTIQNALYEYLGCNRHSDGYIRLNWTLRYAQARRTG